MRWESQEVSELAWTGLGPAVGPPQIGLWLTGTAGAASNRSQVYHSVVIQWQGGNLFVSVKSLHSIPFPSIGGVVWVGHRSRRSSMNRLPALTLCNFVFASLFFALHGHILVRLIRVIYFGLWKTFILIFVAYFFPQFRDSPVWASLL